MKVQRCLELAAEWVRENEAALDGFVGAYVGGSTAAMAPDAEIKGGSDMDVYVALERPAPPKRGKFGYKGALIEISYTNFSDIYPAEKALGDYHIANSLRYGLTLADTDGRLAELQAEVKEKFYQKKYIALRRDHALSRVRGGLEGMDSTKPLPDKTLSWLFPTGITTHAVLVAALKNPTVRLRYLRAREVLEETGLYPEYEKLLEISGFADVTPCEAETMLNELEPLYDAAARLSRTEFFFSSDVSPQSRATAIDASRELIQKGYHRETLFWTITTYARAMRMLLTDAPHEYAKYLPRFEKALRTVNRETDEKISAAARITLDYLPELIRLTDGIIDRQKTE